MNHERWWALSATHVSVVHEQVELLAHAGNGGGGQVCAIHEGDAVEDADGDDEATIDVGDDLLLLLGGEAKVVRVGVVVGDIVGRRAAGLVADVIKVFLLGVPLAGGVHVEGRSHDGGGS